ncbi:hypothetical protein ACVILH_001518 [Bradyrhizobium sp. USDA 4353]
MEKMAATVGRDAPPARGLAPGDTLPEEYWRALLDAAEADRGQATPGVPRRSLRLGQTREHVLRVGCRRCGRTVEIQKTDAQRLYGQDTPWKTVAQRLLDDTCTQRTGRYEEDGCWPSLG